VLSTADIIAVAGNPLQSIAAMSDAVFVMKDVSGILLAG